MRDNRMAERVSTIAVTGAGGQIAYSLLFRLAAGELLGSNRPLSLNLLEVPQALDSLKGVAMELRDCAFPLLRDIRLCTSSEEAFAGASIVFMIGSKPRGPGMERNDLLQDNGRIFVEQGKALSRTAEKETVALVVGNPCNTNCWIAHHLAGNKVKLFSMTRLDQNRAVSMLAEKAQASIADVTHVTIWGNHSTTQVPDFMHGKIRGKAVTEAIQDRSWLEHTFVPAIQQRGAVVIAARGKSSAASAASAAIDAMRSLITPTPQGTWFSMGCISTGNPYNIAPDLVFSFPCRSQGAGNIEIVPGLTWDPFLKPLIRRSEQELIDERSMVEHLL